MSLNEQQALQTRYGVTYQPVGQDGIQIVGLDGQRTTVGHHRSALSAVLDHFAQPGSESEALAKLTESGLAEPAAIGAIEFLTGRGFIADVESTDGADPLLHLIRAVHPRAGDPEEDLFTRLDRPVVIMGEGAVARAAAAAVASLGMDATVSSGSAIVSGQATIDPEGLMIVCADTDDFQWFRSINRAAVQAGSRGFYARLSGAQMILGPYVVPRKRPCFGCYADRVEANVAFIKEFKIRTTAHDRRGRALEVEEGSLVMAGMRYHLGVSLAWHLLGRLNTSRQSEVHHIDLATGEIEKASLLRAPRCEVCGSGRDADPKWGVRDLL